MRKLCFLLTALLLTAPAFAGVTITCAQVGVTDECQVSYVASDDANIPRAFGLDITLDNTETITGITDANEKYWVFPGTIQIVDGSITDEGEPVAPGIDPGALGGIDTNGMTIEMGSLYDANDPEHQDGPPLSGSLLSFTVSGNCTVQINGNAARGNVVLEDTSEASTNLPSECEMVLNCWTGDATSTAAWQLVGSPECWCSAGDPNANPRQCHGDADTAPIGKKNWWVSTPDLTILKDNWQINNGPVTQPGICADFDRLPIGKKNWRVSTPDLTILKKNWQINNGPDPNCQDVIGSQE